MSSKQVTPPAGRICMYMMEALRTMRRHQEKCPGFPMTSRPSTLTNPLLFTLSGERFHCSPDSVNSDVTVRP
jgi:hypothetical protein